MWFGFKEKLQKCENVKEEMMEVRYSYTYLILPATPETKRAFPTATWGKTWFINDVPLSYIYLHDAEWSSCRSSERARDETFNLLISRRCSVQNGDERRLERWRAEIGFGNPASRSTSYLGSLLHFVFRFAVARLHILLTSIDLCQAKAMRECLLR